MTRGRRGSATAIAGALLVLCALRLPELASAAALTPPESSRTTPAQAVGPRAPSRPPLLSGTGAAGGSGEEEAVGAAAPGEADPLVSNGLGSPSCRGELAGELSSTDREHCETSGFVAAPAPTGDYGIDVHIDTGLLGLSAGGLLSTVQDLFVTPLWMALVWAVHALVVMLEWSFTIDLLDSAASGGLARGLRQAQASFTGPWLALALAVASVLALYQGLIRRRVSQTLGETLLMGAMMAGGIWLIADPAGTLGAIAEWASEAALGTLAVAAHGTPATPGRALGTSLDTVFAAAVEGPWCYLEFGDVSWCREPSRLDPGLRAAGLAIAAHELAQAGCEGGGCTSAGGSGQALQHSARLLRDARSNGAIFLALPANGPARNSINEQGSLLRTICQSSEAEDCRGPSAAEAEFRTGGQTWSRVAGLVLIATGLLGMLLLLGFVILRLLAAAIFSLLYLLLAPAMVLAPAFGEGGRALFRRWAAQLLGAVVSKLVFSFLLGVVLAVLGVIADLSAIGWWTQWLLMSAFWWGAYTRRHQALGVLGGAVGRERIGHRSVVRRVSDALETRKAFAAGRWVKARRSTSAPTVSAERPAERASAGGSGASRPDPTPTQASGQARRSLEHEHRGASARMKAAGQSRRRTAALRTQLERVLSERAGARLDGDRRRAAKLTARGERIEGEIERERGALAVSRAITKTTANAHSRDHAEERERFLDAQAALAPSAQRADRAQRRDYPALAGLAGYAREEYERLDAREQRTARLEIDRELALRHEHGSRFYGGPGPHLDGEPAPEGTLERAREQARPAPDGRPAPAPEQRRRGPRIATDESPVLRDMREVAEGRKRQLGRDRR